MEGDVGGMEGRGWRGESENREGEVVGTHTCVQCIIIFSRYMYLF